MLQGIIAHSRRLSIMPLILVVMLFLAACTQTIPQPATSDQADTAASSTDQATTSDEVSIAFGSELTTMDPPFFNSSNEQGVYYHLFDTLVTRDEESRLIPGLAESWETVDENTWEFKLREGVKFHDGTELTSDDVKYTFDRIIGDFMENPARSKLATISEVQAVDSHTVRIITELPDPILLARLAGIVTWVVPKDYIEANGHEHFARNPVGTGPYRFVEWVKDERLVLEANPDYWGGAPDVQRIVYRPVPEASTRLALLQTGDVDMIQNVPPDQLPAIEGDPNLEVSTTPSLRSMYLILRSDMPPTDDVKVRQAINYAINKESVVNDILGGYGIVSQGQVMGPEYFGYNPDLEPYPYDPEMARQLLEEAGYPDGLEVELLSPAGRYPQDQEIAEAIAGQLGEVGINVDLELVEFGIYVERKLDRTIDPITLGAWSQPVYDADGVLYLLFHSDEPWGVHYSNTQVDEWVQQARSTIDQDERLELYTEAAEIVREEAPVAFLHQLVYIHAKRVDAPVLARPDETILVYRKWE